MIFYHEHIDEATDLTGAEFEVYVKEVASDAFSSTQFVDWETMTKVKSSGPLSLSEDKMVVTLDEPFQYIGANLLIGIKKTKKADNYLYFNNLPWYGVEATNASIASTFSNTVPITERQNFMPKITFASNEGEEPGCITPIELAVSYTGGTTATITWIGASDSYNIDINGTVTENVTSPYELTDLDLATTYTVKVQGDCGGGSTSDWSYTLSFTTDLCEPENQCTITFELHDDEGDGWNGAAIQVVDVLTNRVISSDPLCVQRTRSQFRMGKRQLG